LVDRLQRAAVKESCAWASEDDDEVLLESTGPSPLNCDLDTQEMADLLTVQAPDCVIVDEGHKLSNPKSCLARALARLATRRRIVCTGTPVQNSLWEYHALVEFVRPGYWNRKEFGRRFAPVLRPEPSGPTPASPDMLQRMGECGRRLQDELAALVHPCGAEVLQRELPPLHEFVVVVPLTQVQAKVYTDLVAHSLKAAARLQTRRVLYLSVLLQKIGTHPDLARQYCVQQGVDPRDGYIDTEEERDEFSFTQQERRCQLLSRSGKDFTWARPLFTPGDHPLCLEGSTKMVALFAIIAHSMALGEKVLVYSQWAATLDLIEMLLQNAPPSTGQTEETGSQDAEGWCLGREYLRLDGMAPAARRQTIIDRVNAPDSPTRVLLCGIRAAGLGINLTGATRVVLVDASWNPQADRQAIHRAYRYGQTRPVFVYRLLNEGTIEQTIFRRTHTKMLLLQSLVGDNSVEWKRKDLNAIRYVGPPPPDALQIDHRWLEADPILRALYDRRVLCSVECTSPSPSTDLLQADV